MKNFRYVAVALLSGFILTANGAAPKASGYLDDYDHLVEGEYLEAYWVNMAGITRSESPRIALGDISTANIKIKKNADVTIDECKTWLTQDLLSGSIISKGQGSGYRLDLAITYVDPGSAAARLWAGEFGAGHAFLQIEGKVVDVESGEVVAAFAERRRSSGALGLEDLGGDAGPHIIEHLVSLISSDITSELLATFTAR